MISFQNKGLIDLRAVTSFGVSSKDCENPIGFFGTGLKYAIAVILRNGGKFSLFRGLDEYIFTLETSRVRNDDFEFICMNGEPLAFTSEVGKNWKPWMAFRELYSNTLDEAGNIKDSNVNPEAGFTTIQVIQEGITDAFYKKHVIFLESCPIHTFSSFDVHPKPSKYVYYRGIRVAELESTAQFTYNIKSACQLTEDRTLSSISDATAKIRRAVSNGETLAFMRQFLTAPDGSFEQRMDVNFYATPSDEFNSLIKEIGFGGVTNLSAVALYKNFTKEKYVPETSTPDSIQAQQLTRAIHFCNEIGYPVDKFPINFTDELKNSVLGLAYEREIYICKRAYSMGTKMVASTLIEEYLHIEKDLNDCDRKMQNFLFDALVSMGEKLMGEPI